MLTVMVLLLIAVVHPSSALAQAQTGILVDTPDLNDYPSIQVDFRAMDNSGLFIDDLNTSDLTVLENGSDLPVDNLELVKNGVRFYVAVNEGPTLANRYSGLVRFDQIKNSLIDWVEDHTAVTEDEFGIYTNQGALAISDQSQQGWRSTLDAYQPDLRNATPGLSSLSGAVDAALVSGAHPGKKTAVLFITPLPSGNQFSGLQDIIARAKGSGIPVFIWLVGPKDYAISDDAQLLRDYAIQTGGDSFIFSGVETLPAIANYLDPLGFSYHLSYTTLIDSSRSNTLALVMKREGTLLESAPLTFETTISSPLPIFLSPPTRLDRVWSETKKKKEATLSPASVEIQILVEFPDKLKRSLTYSRLFVDNHLVAENTAEPFETFEWDISEYSTSTSHVLQVTIEDVAGLSGKTIGIPVEVVVGDPPKNFFQVLTGKLTPFSAAVGGLLLILVIGGIAALFKNVRDRSRSAEKTVLADPLTQPVEIKNEYVLLPSKQGEIRWPVIQGQGLAPARLVLKSKEDMEAANPIEVALGTGETVFGTERKKVDVVLAHPSVSGVHARIFKDAEDHFRVADVGSAAGTWVNYAPVSSHGARLENGDLVHFGRVVYLFEVHGAVPKRVQVLPYKE